MACIPALAACSLLLGEGFTDPNAPALATDASTSADSPANGGEGGPPIVGSDAAPDTGGDAVRPDPEAGGTICPTATVSFCDDFERSVPQDDWAGSSVSANASLTIETSNGSKALFSSISAKGATAQLTKAFAPVPQKFHLAFDLQMTALAVSGGVYIGGLFMQTGLAAPSLVYVYTEPGGVWFVQQVADDGGYIRDQLPISTGTNYRVDIDLTFNGKLIVNVNGTKVVDRNAEAFLVPHAPTLHVGASSIDGLGNGGSFRMDDLVFTID